MQIMIFATGLGPGSRDKMQERQESVNRIQTFKDMNEEYIHLLKPLFERYSCHSGDTVIQQGEEADYLYLIIDGKAQVSYKPYDGTPITIAHVEKDGLFGWSAVVGSRTYTSSVTAIEDLVTFRIHGNELRKLCLDHPDAGREILERLANVVSSRWKNSQEQVKAILINAMTN
jgi:CRP-like cAMP-binding protein